MLLLKPNGLFLKRRIRCSISFKNAVGKYTAVSNEFIDDKELSYKAVGLLLTILRNSDEWRIYPEELAKRRKDSIVSVRSGLKELEEAGYIRTYKKSLGRGKGMEYHRFCSDRKITDGIFETLKRKLDDDLQN